MTKLAHHVGAARVSWFIVIAGHLWHCRSSFRLTGAPQTADMMQVWHSLPLNMSGHQLKGSNKIEHRNWIAPAIRGLLHRPQT